MFNLSKLALEFVDADEAGKKYFGIKDPIPKFTEALANSVGKVTHAPASLIIHQEKVLEDLKGAQKKVLEEKFKHLKDRKELADTLVRLNHADPIQDFLRVVKNKSISIPERILYSVPTAFGGLGAAVSRSDHYNPYSDVVTSYSGVPEVTAHELGHAADLAKATALKRALISLGRKLDDTIGLRGGITTQVLESNANREAEKDYEGDKREFRRRLWPARSTYVTALGMSLPTAYLKILNRAKGMSTRRGILGKLSRKLLKFDNKKALGKQVREVLAKVYGHLGKVPWGLGSLVPVAGGALLGRLAAEGVNLFDRKSTDKKEKTAEDKLKGGKGDNQPDSKYNKKELAKGIKHETEHTGDKALAKEIAKDHLEENESYYTELDKAKIGSFLGLLDLLD